MSIVPAPELKEWVSLIKDVLVGLAAIFTIGLGVYGLKQWKHEHRGKEAFSLVKQLIKESHKMVRACTVLRCRVNEMERLAFDANECKLLTKSERWKVSEKEVFDKRFDKFREAEASYREALLDARAVLGSHIYAVFLDFGKHLTANVVAVNGYLDSVLSESFLYIRHDHEKLVAIQNQFLISQESGFADDLSASTADAREVGEKALVKYLGRADIRG